jgi:hypothetical protein
MLISYRLGLDNFMEQERLDVLSAFLEQHRSGVDEISLFTEGAHGYHPLEFLEERVPGFDRALRRFQGLGWRVGINLLNTIGHLDEAPGRLWETPFQKMVGHDGAVALASSCPLDPAYLEDVRQRYHLMATLKPDFIWVDDDVRINSHAPAKYCCFCPLCLADISRRLGREFTRESLVEALSQETWPEVHSIRRAWDLRNDEAMLGILRAVELGAHAAAPGLELGLMATHSDRVAVWLDVLAGPDHAPVRMRPGAGWYMDDCPAGLFEKALTLGATTAYARPERLASIQCEIENFPYQKLKKSVHLNMVESACYQAAGCTGIAYNILTMEGNSYDDYEARMAGIEKWRPFFERLVAWGGHLPARGLGLAASPEYHEGGYFGGWGKPSPSSLATLALRELGLAQAFRTEDACATVLAGGAISAFPPEEIRGLLAGGVIADAEAATWIEKLGLGHLLGVHAEPIYPGALRERLTGHPLNGAFGGQYRNAWLGFFNQHGSGSGAHRLEPLSAATQVLAEMVFYYGEESLGASVTAFENELGGRVAVLGYSPWERTHNTAKRAQLGALAAWASRDTLPAWSPLCHPVTLFARGEADGSPLLVTAVNGSADASGPIPLRLTTAARRAWLATPAQPASVAVEVVAEDAAHATVMLPELAPWQMCALRLE